MDPKERPTATSLKDYEFFVKNVGDDGGPVCLIFKFSLNHKFSRFSELYEGLPFAKFG